MNNGLLKYLHQFAPNIDAQTRVRDIVSEADLPNVVLAYNAAITRTFCIAAVTCRAAVIAAFGMGWVNIKKSKLEKAQESASQSEDERRLQMDSR